MSRTSCGHRYVQAVAPDYERLERWGGGEGITELRRIESDCKAIYGIMPS